MIVNSLRAVNEYSVWPDGTLQRTMKSEKEKKKKKKSVCLSRTRFVIRGNFRQYILLAGLQLSSYRLSSVDIRLASTINQLSVHHYSSLPCLRWRLVDDCCLLAPHLFGVAVGLHNFVATVCDICRHPWPCPVAGTGLLVTTWCRLSPVFIIIDEGCDCCHAFTSWTSVLSALCYWFDQCF